ncbi:MAG: hypothetical protein ACTTJG_03930 [Treponema sp.]
MKTRRTCLFSAILFVFLFASCKSPLDVLSDYNSHFEKAPAVSSDILSSGKAHLMLNEFYKVRIDHTLVLTAPMGGENYSWKITDVGGKTPYIEKTDMRLSLYIPNTDLYAAVLAAPGKSRLYEILLTVEKNGNSYSDSAVIVLYATD